MSPPKLLNSLQSLFSPDVPFHWHFGISSEITTAKALSSHRAGPPATVAVQSTHSYSCSKWDQPAYSLGSLQACSCSCCASTCSTLSKAFVLHEYTGPEEYQMRCPGSCLQPSAAPVTNSAPSRQHHINVNVWVSFPSGSWAQGESVPLLIYCYIFSKNILLHVHSSASFS